MMNSYELLEAMLTALASDKALTAMCRIWFNAAPAIFIDHDPNNPPSPGQAPTIQLHSPEKSADENAGPISHLFFVAIDIEAPEDTLRPESNVTEFSAVKMLAEIVHRCLVVLRAAKPSGYDMDYQYQTDTITAFPVFSADIIVSLTCDYIIGRDPLDLR